MIFYFSKAFGLPLLLSTSIKILFVISLIVILPISAVYSQGLVEINGIVKSGHQFIPLHKAKIRSGIRSTRSSYDGTFQLKIKEGEPLFVYHTRHHTQEIPYSHLRRNDTLTFYLTPSSLLKNEILEGSQAEKVHAPFYEHVFDYSFLTDTLVVISYMGVKPTFDRLSDTYVNSAFTALRFGYQLRRQILPDYVTSLKKLPSGELFLNGLQSVYLVSTRSEKFEVLPVEVSDYNTQLEPIYAQRDSMIYYTYKLPYIPLVAHKIRSAAGEQGTTIRIIQNKEYVAKVNDDLEMLNPLELIEIKELESETGISQSLFAPFVRSAYLLRNLSIPYAPGFLINDTVQIFDHSNLWLFRHSWSGGAIDSVPIYHGLLPKEELRQVIQDPISEQLYTHHDRGGTAYIRKIDLNTGSSGRAFKLRNPFPERIKIFEGYIYYLFKTPLDKNTRHLLREKLPFE